MRRLVQCPRIQGVHLGILVACCAVALINRRDLEAMAAREQVSLEGSDLLVFAALNPYVMVYFVVPVTLVLMLRRIAGLVDPSVLMRNGSLLGWLTYVGARILGDVILVVGSVAAASLVVAIGRPGLTQWSQVALAEPTWATFSFAHLGWGPVALALFGLAAAALNLVAMGVMLAAVSPFTGTSGRVAGAAAAYVSIVVTFSQPTPLALLNTASGFVLELAMAGYGASPWVMLVPCAIAGGSAVLLSWKADQYLSGQGTGAHWRLLVTSICVGMLWMSISARNAVFTPTHPEDLFTSAFYGLGREQASLLDYLVSAVLALAPVIVALVSFEEQVGGASVALLRHGSILRWWSVLLRPGLIHIVGHWSVLMVVGAAASWWHASERLALAPYLPGMVLVLGILQSGCYLIMVLLGRWAVGTPAAGVGMAGVLFAAGFVLGPIQRLPAGLNSLGLALDGQAHPATSAVVLGLWLMALAALSLFFANIRFLERNL